VDVNGTNRPPNAPRTLTLAKDTDGSSVLQWSAPSPADPDQGDSIVYYRIYRDGTDSAHRYLTVGGLETTAVDTKPAGATHQYWVSAVDSHLAESALLGPVSG
jgi:fibronectin type 3 domain-containing protein